MFSQSSFVGKALLEKAALVFEGLGYSIPRADTNSSGAYVMNIVNQYQGDLTEEQIRAILKYAYEYTKNTLLDAKNQGSIDREAVFGERTWPEEKRKDIPR